MTDHHSRLATIARTAATGEAHWQHFFGLLRDRLPALDRICAALQIDAYTAYLPRVAQAAELDPLFGRDGLFADREQSKTFEVIAEGVPYLVRDEDWDRHPDLAFYGIVMRSNLKVPVSLGGHPTVWNLWSRGRNAFGDDDIATLVDLGGELSRSPFILRPLPVGLALRRAAHLMETRARALAA